MSGRDAVSVEPVASIRARAESIEIQATALQIRTAVATCPVSLLLGMLAALIVAAFADRSNGERLDRVAIWAWWLAVATSFGVAALVCRRFNRSELAPAAVIEHVMRGRRWTAIVLACAVSLGAVSWVLLPAGDRRLEMLVIAFMIAMLTGHGGSQAAYPPLMVRFLGPATAVFALGLSRIGEAVYTLIGVGFVVLTMGIYRYTVTQARAARQAILLEREASLARQQAEEAHRAADRANRSKTAFMAVVGHDLRQPMHALVQHHARLRRSNEDPGLAETIDRFGTSLDAMQDLLNSILDVSRLMTGLVVPSITVVRVDRVLDRIDAQMRVLALDKGLQFDVHPHAVCVSTDEVLFERILRNLLLNAIRYTSQGSVGIRVHPKHGALIVRVFDSGPGIGRDEREKVFDYFYQIGNDARRRQRGLGLGLAIVKELTRLLSIEVVLRSRPGRGCIFRLTMPMTGALPTAAIASRPATRDHVRGALVLLIDDDAESLRATADTVAAFGARVVSAASVMEALSRLQAMESVPELIVSDYRLEDQTGPEAIALVRATLQLRFGDDILIQALLISGDTSPQVSADALNAGLRLLHKPIAPDDLHAAVNAELGSLAMRDT